MTCSRCRGFLYAYEFWRCANCGNVEDGVILANRRLNPEQREAVASTKAHYGPRECPVRDAVLVR